MARTFSYTSTKTFARIDLLSTQIRIALRRTTDISPSTLEQIELGVKKQWIQMVNLYRFDNKNLCRAEVILEIDWDEHKLQLSKGKATVLIDVDKWTGDTAIELDEAIMLFNQFVADESLRTKWTVTYTKEVHSNKKKQDEVDKILGFKTADPIKWSGQKKGVNLGIPELSEFHIGLYLSDDV